MDVRTGFLGLVVALLGAIAVLMVAPLLQYVVAAALLAFLLYPVHERLVPTLGTRLSAILLTAFGVIAAIVPLIVFSMIVLETAVSFIRQVDQSVVVDAVEWFLFEVESLDGFLTEEIEQLLIEEVRGIVFPMIETLLLEVTTILGSTIRISVGVMVLVFLLYYFLTDGPLLLAWIRRTLPFEDGVLTELFDEIDVVTWAVLKSHVFVAIVEGVLGGIGLYLVGVPNVAFWTVVMIVVSILPIVGVWLVWGPAVIYLFAVGDTFGATILLVYGIAVLSIVDNYLRAIFVERGSGLHPAVVLIGVIGGIYLLGIIGLFLGPILLAVFKASLVVFSRTYESNGT